MIFTRGHTMIKNQLKTTILLAVLTALMLWVGSLWGQSGLVVALVFALLMNFGAYFFADKIVLAMYRAKEIKEKDAPQLFKIIHEVIHLAKIPMPKVYLIPTMTPNAFATGRNPKHAVVAVTEGILQLLNKDELKGVIAHEVGHIKNRDILIQTIAATIAGVISYIASMAQWAAIFGNRDRDGGNMIQLLVLAILTPVIATIIQLAISRSREFLADESAAKTLHNPHGLINALEKLERGVAHKPLQFGSAATSSLFIVNPFRSNAIFQLFSTHPSTAERVRRLKNVSL